ncbi:MAG: VOC family protein [Deltaproteobacteria bacterium]|nr:VOC family protein [Nitrospirota bacterium]MBI3576559.1 VOC family protein [Candidatus Gottesmanbacteria bacterium]MBI3755887.1 VOC family protein [Deltaproteobacteria bacterium]
MKNAINWFEIPVKNFDRGKKFYSTILGGEINEMPNPQMKYGFLPFDMKNGGVGGAIVQGEGYEPSGKGSLIYLNGGDDLGKVLSKVEKAGGKILLPKTSIGQNGFMAHFLDTEGNKVALHSMK